jgi:hypothetical protein
VHARSLPLAGALFIAALRLPAQAIDTAVALGALRDFAEACRLDDGQTWGRSLCGPIALVEPATRLVVASDTVAGQRFVPLGDAYVTTLPSAVTPSNTSFTWGGRPWAMVILQAVSANRFGRVSLLAHESFHRIQDSLGFERLDAPNTHLEEEEARRLLRLELRALAAALEADDAARRAHVENALVFRAHRHALFPGADSSEARLERHEGLSEYTGMRVALLLMPDSMARVARAVRSAESRPTFVRSFAYGTGPALGLLLDRFAGDAWRDTLRANPAAPRELSAMLASAARIRLPSPTRLKRQSSARAARYGGVAVEREERDRAAERARRTTAYRASLVTGPVLVITSSEMNRAFNPNELFPLGEDGVVYPTGTFTAPWGTLTVTDGALLSHDFRTLRVAAPSSDTSLTGPGWSLQLADGWRLGPSTDRAGDFRVLAPR